MAKYNEGDKVRSRIRISFGTVHIRPTTIGVIKNVKKKSFGKSEYTVRFNGVGTDLICQEKNLDEFGQGIG